MAGPPQGEGGVGPPLEVTMEQNMQETSELIEIGIVGGPDRMSLAIAYFTGDEDEHTPVYFKIKEQLGELKAVSVDLTKIVPESGNSRYQWCFEGTITDHARERTGKNVTRLVEGYYNLKSRLGFIRFKKTAV